MRLTDLDPQWLSNGGEGISYQGQPAPLREKIGVSFLCPCPACTAKRTGTDSDFFLRVNITFSNPEDGLGPIESKSHWERWGTTFEDLVTAPSILHNKNVGCGWHGFIGGPQHDQPGEVVTI